MNSKGENGQFRMPLGSYGNKTESGTVKLHEGVIASVVKNATCSVKGVVRLSSAGLADNIANILGTNKRTDRAVSVDLSEDKVSVEVSVVVAYGENIPELAVKIQNTVINEIKQITGMTASSIDVVIQEIEDVSKSEQETNNKEEKQTESSNTEETEQSENNK